MRRAALVLILLLAGCGRAPKQESSAVAVPTPVPGSTNAPKVEIEGNEWVTGEPTADPSSIEAVRDTIAGILWGQLTPGDTALHLSTERGGFKYWYAADSAAGWVVRYVVNDTSACPVETIEHMLFKSGWTYADGYSADGPDGTVLGLKSRKFLCIIEGRWEGGDDSDSTYVPKPGCVLTATVVPRNAQDVIPK